MDRFAFFAAMPFLTATTTTTTTCESDSESGEDIFTGVCSFSVSAREQYGDEGGEDDEDEDEAREGLAARDARHLVFALTEKHNDHGGCVETTVRLRHVRKRDSQSESTLDEAPNAAYLEIELDGATYALCTRLAKKVVFASGNRSGSVEDVITNAYVSVIFPHVTLNIYSTAPPTDWSGHGSLNALARALNNADFSAPPRRASDVEIDPREALRLQRHAADVLIDVILHGRLHENDMDDDYMDDDDEDEDALATVDGRLIRAARAFAACPKPPYRFFGECDADRDRDDECLLLSLDDDDDDHHHHDDTNDNDDDDDVRSLARLATAGMDACHVFWTKQTA